MSEPVNIPPSSGSPLSLSPCSSASGSPLQLDPSTLALLDQFLTEKTEAEEKFAKLEEAAHARLLSAQNSGEDGQAEEGKTTGKMLSVDEFREMFGEDWQLSQFWYSTSFAHSLATYLTSLLPSVTPATSSPRIAFLCSPTAYVGFQSTTPLPAGQAKLLEYDRRFALFGGKDYVPYDIDSPEDVPQDLLGSVDIAVADPPFLNEVTNKKLAQTLGLILRPTGRLVLLTSTSVQHLFPSIYSESPLGPLYESPIKVHHAGGIANDFGVWTSWKIEDGERLPGFEKA